MFFSFSFLLALATLALVIAIWRGVAAFDRTLRDIRVQLTRIGMDVAALKLQPAEAAPAAAQAVKEAAPFEPGSVESVALGAEPEEALKEEATPPEAEPAPEPIETEAPPEAAIEEPPPPESEPPPQPEPEKPSARDSATSEGWQRPLKPAAPTEGMEQKLASRWFVWAGGVALAVAGVLFVKYAHDQGLFPPALRATVGVLAGLGLVGFSEYVRRGLLKRMDTPTYVPAALSAAGLLMAFGSLYAGYALYELLSPGVAFAGLALIAIGAIGLSLLQGPLIGALGLLGAYLIPTLIPSTNPSGWIFFPYLAIILAASLLVLRRRDWWWLGFLGVLGALVWSLLWMFGGVFETTDIAPLGLFALFLGAASFFAVEGRDSLATDADWDDTLYSPFGIGMAGIAAGALSLMALATATSHNGTALIFLAAAAIGVMALAILKPKLAELALAMAAAVFLALIAWREASFFQEAMDETGYWDVVPGPDQWRYFLWMSGFGLAFGLVGLAMAMRHVRASVWALLAAGGFVVFGAAAWVRVPGAIGETAWAAMGIAAALALGFGVTRVAAGQDDAERETAASVLTLGAILALLFAEDRLFDRAWLSVAMGVTVVVFALIFGRLRLTILPVAAMGLAALVAVRLFVSHELWSEGANQWLGQHWLLYGYGVPAIAFWLASRVFGKSGAPQAQAALEGGALALGISLISLEVRVLIGGGVTNTEFGFLEASVHALAWLAAAYGLAYRQAVFPNHVSYWGGQLLAAAGIGLLVTGCMIRFNPLLSGDPVVGGPVFNSLILAYLLPPVVIGLLAQKLAGFGWERLKTLFGALALAMGLTYITLQTKRVFQGPLLDIEILSQAENYTHSATWLLFGLALFVAGLHFARAYFRYAGLGVLVIVSLKVFLYDLAGLDGLYRIASFAGLGICLIGIGYLYARYVQNAPEKTEAT